MGDPQLAHASHLAAPVPAGAAVGAASRIWTALEDLDAQELRLYALGWGDHLPSEVLERIATLHRQRLALERQIAHQAAVSDRTDCSGRARAA